jgi:hypothetical protein
MRSAIQALAHLKPLIAPVPPAPTVWRALSETGELQLSRLNTAVTDFRRHWWALLAAPAGGIPWLKVAGRELTGVTVAGLDATIVFAASGKDNAVATYKGRKAPGDHGGESLVTEPASMAVIRTDVTVISGDSLVQSTYELKMPVREPPVVRAICPPPGVRLPTVSLSVREPATSVQANAAPVMPDRIVTIAEII